MSDVRSSSTVKLVVGASHALLAAAALVCTCAVLRQEELRRWWNGAHDEVAVVERKAEAPRPLLVPAGESPPLELRAASSKPLRFPEPASDSVRAAVNAPPMPAAPITTAASGIEPTTPPAGVLRFPPVPPPNDATRVRLAASNVVEPPTAESSPSHAALLARQSASPPSQQQQEEPHQPAVAPSQTDAAADAFAEPLPTADGSSSPPNPWARFLAAAAPGAFTEHGTVTLDDVRAMALANNKDVAVLGHAPRLAATAVDSELAVFDPVLNLAASGGQYKRQTSTQIDALGASIPVLRTSFWQPITAPNQLWIEKLFVTGGRVQAGVGQNLLNYSPPGSFVTVNPAFTSSLNLMFEQPLFRGRGAAATMATTHVARANQQQSWHAFQAVVNQVLRDAELAYWETYAAYQDFEVRDLALAQALETVERERERLRLGEGAVPDVAQAEEQAEAFRIARAEAETNLQAAQRNLRRVMGLPPSDERSLIPASPPYDAPLAVDWNYAVAEAQQRPEFAAQRAAVEAARIELARRRNGLLPDVSVQALYSVSGLDSNFGDAWGNVGSWNYNDWTAGVVYRQPLGRRADHALAQRAAETVRMETSRLNQLEHEIVHELDAAYQNVQAAARMLDMHRRRREAAAVQLEARRALYQENRASLRDQLDAEARYAAAMLDEALARVDYQRAITAWNYARGAMTGDGVVVQR